MSLLFVIVKKLNEDNGLKEHLEYYMLHNANDIHPSR